MLSTGWHPNWSGCVQQPQLPESDNLTTTPALWSKWPGPWRWISRQAICFTDTFRNTADDFTENTSEDIILFSVIVYHPSLWQKQPGHVRLRGTFTPTWPSKKTHQKNSHLGKETASPQMAFSTTGSWDKSSLWLLWVEWGGWIHQHQLKGPGDRINRTKA